MFSGVSRSLTAAATRGLSQATNGLFNGARSRRRPTSRPIQSRADSSAATKQITPDNTHTISQLGAGA